jgi:hypothetical protein
MMNRMKMELLFAALFLCGAATLSAQVIDNSPTRVQTTLNPGLKRLGTLTPKNVRQIDTSHWTLGCETIDREYADYHSYKEYLPALGIKRIRLQGGWARTEKDPGIYDFAWLDSIVDDARSRGLRSGSKPATAIRPIPAPAGARSTAGSPPLRKAWPPGTAGSRRWRPTSRAACATGACGTSRRVTKPTRRR